MTIRKMVGTLSLTAAMAMTAFAHHSFTAEFDNNKPVKLQGKLKEMKWSNPHSWIYIDVDTNGKTVNWALETGAANALIRRGWKKGDLPAGTVLVVDGWPGIIVPTIEGRKWVALEPVQIKKAQNKNGTWRWWQYWKVRDLPQVGRLLRGAVVHIRHSYSAKEDGDQSRSTVLRLFPEGSPGYKATFPRRNDVESRPPPQGPDVQRPRVDHR